MGDVRQDIRFAIRSFARSPGLFLVALITLALGIGANTAIFSVVHSVLLRPLDYPESERVMQLGHAALDGSTRMSVHTPGNFFDWKEAARSFESMAAYSYATASLLGSGDPTRIEGARSVGSIFDVLGTPALIGRTFTDGEDGTGPEDVVVLSHGLWQRVYGGSDIVGESISLSGSPHTVLGVMPAGFDFPSPATDFWVLSDFSPEFMTNRTEYYLRTIARLGPDRTPEQARQEMEGIAARLREEYPQANGNVTVAVIPLHEMIVGDVRALLLLLVAAVGVVLLIACTNLANLLMSRAQGREHEIAVRRALGAGRGRLVRQVFTESTVLAVAGGLAGLGVGALMLEAIITWMPGGLPRVGEVAVDGTVLAFTLGVSLFASLLFGSFPAMQLVRTSSGGRLGAQRGSSNLRLGGGLVVAEVALAVLLLVGAGLLARSFGEMASVDPGYETENRLTFQVSISGEKYDLAGQVAFFRELDETIAATPGVTDIGFTTGLPASFSGSGAWLNIMDRPLDEGSTPSSVSYRVVSPGYLPTMGIRLLRGRSITRADGLGGTPSVVINQAMADQVWPGEEALGKQITLGPDGGWIPPATIVGIVSNVRMNGVSRDVPPVVYGPHELMPWWTGFTAVVHSTGDPARLLPQIRESVTALDPTVPIYEIASVGGILSASFAAQRNAMILVGVLAGVALLMAMVGVFGVLSFAVSRRSREIGIRIALGAAAGDVRSLVMRQGMQQVALGVTAGLAGAFGLTRFMGSLLFGISPMDPWTLLAVAGSLVAAAALATYLPARRATKVDPVRVLAE